MLYSYEELDLGDLRAFGNKALCQVKLSRLGFCVPEGCVLSVPIGEMDVIAAYAELRRRFVPALYGACLLRSSAMMEDGAQSFAGIYQSIPFVAESFESFESAMRELTASYGDQSARDYMERVGITSDMQIFSALIQRVVPATCSGVAYSHNPITGAQQVIIESTFGLNFLVTDGKISPDRIYLDEEGNALRRETGSKKKYVSLSNGKAEIVPMDAARTVRFSLTDAQIHQLWRTVNRLYELQGAPQDVEWAFQEDTLYILQSRDITTLGG